MVTRVQSVNSDVVVALIATRGRLDLLRERAIPSVLGQTRLPDRLVIVVDQTKEELSPAALEEIGKQLRVQAHGELRVTVLRNRRTPKRAAAAWNTGIDQLFRDTGFYRPEHRCFVAILDDDDSWEPNHIEACFEAAISRNLNMVAPGVIRHQSLSDPGHLHSIPVALDAREQFIRGQHIQGSNLFIQLDTLLQAGCFDEHLPSCTDRDLCIRLTDLPSLRFGGIPVHTVHHYADARPNRLSSPASAAKLDGLTRFWRKHAQRFDVAARESAAGRALDLFGWTPAGPAVLTKAVVPPLSRSRRPMAFVVGFITDATPKPHVEGLLSDIVALRSRPDVSGVTVVVVENGPIPNDGSRPLHELVRRFQAAGLTIELVSTEKQREDWAQGTLIDTPDPSRQRLPIALSRTVLNTYVARVASHHPGAAAWILDDDKRLSILVEASGETVERASPDIDALLALRDQGVDIVIGPDTGAAPLPFTATLRMQLLDLAQLVAVFENQTPDGEWLDVTADEAATRSSLSDIYYDLSRHSEHLETPLSSRPSSGGATCADALNLISGRVDRLLAGEQVFRPLVAGAHELSIESATPSVQRGGSTIFFTPDHLLAYPQSLARLGDLHVRRSDMLTALLIRDQMELNIVMHAAAGVRHDRSYTTPNPFDVPTLLADILGYALFRAVGDLMQARPESRRRETLLAWSSEELRQGSRLVRKYTKERLAALGLSAWRVLGLADSIHSRLRRMASNASPWADGPSGEALNRIAVEMEKIRGLFKPAAVAQITEMVRRAASDDNVRNAFGSMDSLISEYRATQQKQPLPLATVTESREQCARALLKRAYGASDLRLLGAGGEGIVFTDEQRVFKVFDLLKRRPNHDTLATLKDLAARIESPKHLYPLTRVEVRDETLLLVYPFEPSMPYAGGRGSELLALLRECKSYGITFRNMHPKNLRVASSGLKLIDYGSDIRTFTDGGYRSMAQRAWLTWRWPHRSDLDELMRRALQDSSMPELDGFDRFWQALNEERPSATRIVSGMVDPIVLESGARSVLDYGCGKKARSARHLAEAGLWTVGFDPGAEMPARWQSFGAIPVCLTLTSDRLAAMSAGPYDAVLSSLVLCELGDDAAYEQVLADLRAAVRPDGVIVVTICNPIATFGEATNLHRRRDLPAGKCYDDSFWYIENAETETGRREYHRPLWKIERDLLRHGLRVERRLASGTIDTERFEPASDFLTLVCRPVRTESPTARVSLVIKTCAMEAATIERQVTHLVSQLEGPRVFCERMLVVDSLRDGFVRQHSSADLAELLEAAERLLTRGVIDRVLSCPGPGADVSAAMKRWFDLECDATHSTGGAPLAAPLLAFEQCVGEYVLQVDSDLLVQRTTRADDYLAEMIRAIESDPNAVTASLSVPQRDDAPFTAHHDGIPWRVEVRGCLLHRQRLLTARPFPNFLDGGRLSLSWHRATDQAVKSGRISSLRGASAQTAFVHPPNELKRSRQEWMLLLDLIEKFPVPEGQTGRVDLVGGPLVWAPQHRSEPFIFVITGRNVPPGRMSRCLESIGAQQRSDWGAVIIDDGSDSLSREALQLAVRPWQDRVTLIQPRERRGQIANMTLAIRHICTDANSVIVTLDLDDALIGPKVLDRVAAAYADGAQVTVGSMLRTDKQAEYPVTFDCPRQARGGNVWQHLRTFRKYLFDAIPDHDLRVGDGYADIAVDWSFMLPIVEMAERRVWIREPLYLYEPSGMGKGAERAARESQIAALVAKGARRPRAASDVLVPLPPDRITSSIWGRDGGILFLRHGERPPFAGLSAEERDAVHLTLNGRGEAESLGRRLGRDVMFTSSPVLRAVQTAKAVAQGAEADEHPVIILDSLVDFLIADRDVYEVVKARLGWPGLMRAWMDGSLAPGVLVPCDQLLRRAIRDVSAAARSRGTQRVVAVTHDFFIMAALAALRGVRTTAVPFLAGAFVPYDEIGEWMPEEVRS